MNLTSLFFLLGITAAACDGERGEMGEPGAPDGTLHVGSLTSGEIVALDPCDASPRLFADVGDASAVGVLADAEADALDPAGSMVVSKFDTGELFRIEIARGGDPGGLTEVTVEPALAGPDGVELLDDGALLVVEGFANRLSAVTLDGDGGTSTVVSNRLDGPTTAAVAGDAAWVVEGQVNDLIEGSQPDVPFRIVRVPL